MQPVSGLTRYQTSNSRIQEHQNPEEKGRALVSLLRKPHAKSERNSAEIERFLLQPGNWQAMNWLMQHEKGLFSALIHSLSQNAERGVIEAAQASLQTDAKSFTVDLLVVLLKRKGCSQDRERILLSLDKEFQRQVFEEFFFKTNWDQFFAVLEAIQDKTLIPLVLFPITTLKSPFKVFQKCYLRCVQRNRVDLMPAVLMYLFQDQRGINEAKPIFYARPEQERAFIVNAIPRKDLPSFLREIRLTEMQAASLLVGLFAIVSGPSERGALVKTFCESLSMPGCGFLWEHFVAQKSPIADYIPLSLDVSSIQAFFHRRHQNLADLRFFSSRAEIRYILGEYAKQDWKVLALTDMQRFLVVCPEFFETQAQAPTSLPEVAGIVFSAMEARSIMPLHESLLRQVPPFLIALASIWGVSQHYSWIHSAIPYLEVDVLEAALLELDDASILQILEREKGNLTLDRVQGLLESLSKEQRLLFLQGKWAEYQTKKGDLHEHSVYASLAGRAGASFADVYKRQVQQLPRKRKAEVEIKVEQAEQPDPTETLIDTLSKLFGDRLTMQNVGYLGLETASMLIQRGLVDESDFASIGITEANATFVGQMVVKIGSSKNVPESEQLVLANLWEIIFSPRNTWESKETKEALSRLSLIFSEVDMSPHYDLICKTYPSLFRATGRKASFEEVVFALYTLDPMQTLKRHLAKDA